MSIFRNKNKDLNDHEKAVRQRVKFWSWQLESGAYGNLNEECYGNWEGC